MAKLRQLTLMIPRRVAWCDFRCFCFRSGDGPAGLGDDGVYPYCDERLSFVLRNTIQHTLIVIYKLLKCSDFDQVY